MKKKCKIQNSKKTCELESIKPTSRAWYIPHSFFSRAQMSRAGLACLPTLAAVPMSWQLTIKFFDGQSQCSTSLPVS